MICHTFAVADRYMLVHWSGLESPAALALVGHYHASRIIPLLFLSVAELLRGAMMPYLSHDWETGARQRVSERMNLILKLASMAMLAGGVVVLWMAPLLFRVGFAGRYDAGLAVMPWTMTYCVWYGLLLIGQNYIWCAERMKLGTLPLATGLAVNVGLNVFLIPAFGLQGAVVSTTFATGIALGSLYAINHRAGMKLRTGTVWLTLVPMALCGGAWIGTAAMFVLAAALPFSKTLLTVQDRELIVKFGRDCLASWTARWARSAQRAEAGHAT
jgi:O-antigen/teichoic acid export membrane protein